MDKINSIKTFLDDKLDSASISVVVEQIAGKDIDNCISAINTVKFYDKSDLTLMSIFLGVFGMDRFHIGDKKLGIMKLSMSILSVGVLFLSFYLMGGVIMRAPLAIDAAFVVAAIALCIFGLLIAVTLIGILADIFICRKRVQILNKIFVMEALVTVNQDNFND